MFLAAWFFGMVTAAAVCLILEQVTKYRGTIMSVDSAFTNVGFAVGSALGGLTLIWFGYEGLGTTLGLLGIAATAVFYFFTKDPSRT
jgi:predicted MFS family arabinose efflux permease